MLPIMLLMLVKTMAGQAGCQVAFTALRKAKNCHLILRTGEKGEAVGPFGPGCLERFGSSGLRAQMPQQLLMIFARALAFGAFEALRSWKLSAFPFEDFGASLNREALQDPCSKTPK